MFVARNLHIHVHIHAQLHVHVLLYTHAHVIVVSWLLQCKGYVPREGCTIPGTVKTMRQLTCTDRPYKANRQISFGARMSSTYCMLAVQHKVLYARCCSYSNIA